MDNIKIDSKDDVVMKILHFFVTKENYKPILLKGVENEIWLENLEQKYKIIRININYLHNKEQYTRDLFKANMIMKKIKKKTFSINMNMLNLLLDVREDVKIEDDNNITSKIVNKITDLKKDDEIKELFPEVIDLKTKKNTPIEFFSLSDDMNQKTLQEEKKINTLFKKKIPYITYGLIAVNVLMFILMYLFGNGSTDVNTLLKFGANNSLLVKNGEIYRLITCAFLHIGLIHILFNMYVLYIIGPEVEKCFGKIKFLLIYLISALVGSLFSCLFTTSVSAGASGAIFGLFGSLLYFGYHYRTMLEGYLKGQILPLIIVNLAIGFIIPGVDVSAHIGGLIGGIVASMAVGLKDKTKIGERINGSIILIVLIAFLSFMLFYVK